MKDKITKEVQAELETKRKLPNELKEKRNKLAIENFMFAIFVTLYFIFLNMGVSNIVKHILVADTKVFSGIWLAIAIIMFEKAFKTSSLVTLSIAASTSLLSIYVFISSKFINMTLNKIPDKE